MWTAATYLDEQTGIKINSCGGHTNTWLGENVFGFGYGVEFKGEYYTAGLIVIPGRLHVEKLECNRP